MTEVIVMTAYGTIESAVEAMRLGAFDYIQKPFTEQELTVKVNKALESRRLHGQMQHFAQVFKERYHLENVVGRSQAIRDVLARVVKIAPTDATALITGESGTGKELVARAIHAEGSRKDAAFVAVNCAAVPEALLESELFGHVRGAFTGATQTRRGLFVEADGGTLLLDEIGDMPLALQAKLLRVLETGEVRSVGSDAPRTTDVRIVAATHQDLPARIKQGQFRQDLFFRLNVVPIAIPPLRERRQDIPLLLTHFPVRWQPVPP